MKKKKNTLLKESLAGIQYEKAYNIKDNSWVVLAKAVPEKSKKLAMGLLMHMTINLTCTNLIIS